ncbi:MAG: folate family ECF transporter S component [Clostridia bacterium]|nr:folate family ECF transporter S component [Clostridia bacterium]
MSNTKKIVTSGLLVALETVLTRFVQIPIVLWGFFNDRVSLGFIPVCLAGILYGPVGGAIIAGVADLLRALIFPQGDINLFFTLIAALRGVIYGIFLHKKITPLRIITASAIIFAVTNLLLKSLVIKFCYSPDVTLWAQLWANLPVAAVNFVVQSVVLILAAKPIERIVKNV